MTFLPLVQRELRVASRERNTYRMRVLAAFLPVLFSAFSLWFVTILGERPIPPRELFLFLVWIEYLFLLIAGFCLTADSISEEKRDATLGLLFLTDLKGVDVVVGKLAGAGVRGLYAALATLPVLALPLLMGGTNGPEFARTSLVLLLTLLLSMCVGIFCSSVMKKAWAALGMSFGIMVGLALAVPMFGEFIRVFYRNPQVAAYIDVFSPSIALIRSFSAGWMLRGHPFEWSVGLLAGMSLCCVVVSSIVTPRVWKDRPPRRFLGWLMEWRRNLVYGSRQFRTEFRRRLLGLNPIFWLTRRERVTSGGFLLLVVGCALLVSFISRKSSQHPNQEARLIIPFVAWIFCAGAIHALLSLRLAVVAADRFGDDRRSGALELLLSTTISVREIIRGHWQGLRRQFTGPALAAWFIHLQPIAWLIMLTPMMSRTRPNRDLSVMIYEMFAHVFGGERISYDWEPHFMLLVMVGAVPAIFVSWIAVASVSMWMSLRVKRAITAPILSVALVHIPPWIVFALFAAFLEYFRLWPFRNDFSHALFCYVVVALLLFANQLFWIRLSRRRMVRDFRTAATDRYQLAGKKRWWPGTVRRSGK